MKTNGSLGAAEGVSRGKTPTNARGQRGVRDGVATAISEKDWRQVVVDYARLRGWLVYFTWRSIHSPSGFPDLILVRGTRFIAAELKTERGKLRPGQVAWLDAIGALPFAQTAVWRPSDWPAVRDALL